MTAKRMLLIPALLPVLLLISCGSEQQSSQPQSYKDMKAMVLDVLKTEDAQKAIMSTAAKNQDKTIQLLSTGEGQQIQLAVKELLTTENHGLKMLEATMTDPKFAGEFAKAAQKNIKQIEKDLLKDPEYQKNLFEALNNPDYQKIILETMKSQKYRQQMQEVVRESLQSPLFKAELIAMFQKAVAEEMKPKDDKTLTITAESGQGGQQGGQQGGGGQGQDQDGGDDQSGGDQQEQESGGQDDQSSGDTDDSSQDQEDQTKSKEKKK
ncbi:spore germination lipoprotein GerD [Paenibacillus sp. YN15]|uniref:spore germination lipoprotein GerD n=1 Tax=Paenibacillus sp. YN15 TaxID=1742774 RepID=UPI0015EB6D79|nr:spore germination lipoprotein GerD [Paenibacillus sp. YN15]